MAVGVARAQPGPTDDAVVRLSVVLAVRQKMGVNAAVRLEDVAVSLSGAVGNGPVTAVPEPGSRVGRAIRFVLTTPSLGPRPGPHRIGLAVATVHVAVEHARAAGPVSRGTILGDTDLAISHDELGSAPLVAVPVRADLIGSRAVRNLAPGEVVTAALVRIQPLVKAGETVQAVFRLGGVEAIGQALAQQSGHRHDRIRLINPESRRPMFGRVTGPGQVEVIHAP